MAENPIRAGLVIADASPEASRSREMHDLYRSGGARRQAAPHVVYADASCPHPGCDQRLHAIDFRLEDLGRSELGPLVRAWWDDTGFAGRCPGCGRWVHFTIQGKHALSDAEAARLPRLPDDWHAGATIL